MLRTRQFAEDAGPLAHPIRPDSYIEINNFYTLTIYEKGAEVVRMLHSLLGAKGFRKGTDLYFQRHDGQAVTTDDFVKSMEAASQQDLGQFRLWYSQAGTPELTVSTEFDEDKKELLLQIRQHIPDTPGQSNKLALHMPFSIACLDEQGKDYLNRVRSASQHMDVLIDELLRLASIARREFEDQAILRLPVRHETRGRAVEVLDGEPEQ